MAKKEISKEIQELKKEITSSKIVIGFKESLKDLKKGELVKVYLSSNCPADMKEDVSRYAALMNINVQDLEMDNEEFGVFCKKHFFISVLGVKK